MVDARQLFESPHHECFPSCTQVTLNHGICDSRCVSCPVGRVNYGDASLAVLQEFRTGTRRHMPFDLFAKVADEVAQYPHAWLRLHARGEPLLHPQIVDLIRYAKETGVRLVQAFTDAIALGDGMARAILDAGLDVLECSIHGHTKTYEQLMRNNRYQQVKKNVIRFRRLRDQSHARTKLVVSAVDQPLFRCEKDAHRMFWSKYADQVIYRPYHSWGNRIDGSVNAIPEFRHPCPQLWTRCTIGPSGKVLACFNSWSEREDEIIGDLKDKGASIAKIWQSSRFARIRHEHAAGNYSLPCCGSCTDWVGSSWGSNSYEHLLRAKLAVGKAS